MFHPPPGTVPRDTGEDGGPDGGEDATPSDSFDGDLDIPSEVPPPEFVFADPPPCGDWEPAEVTAAREVPPGAVGLSVKWAIPLGIRRRFTRAMVQKPDGAVCLGMEHDPQFGCINPDGTIQWMSWYPFYGDAVVNFVVTPQGEVLAMSELGEVIAMRPDGPGADPEADPGILWATSPRSPPYPGYPTISDETPHLFIAAGGYIFLKEPFGDGLYLLDRCGNYRWTLQNMRFAFNSGGVLDRELIVVGQSLQEYWSHYPEDPDGLTSDRLYAIHVDGRMEPIDTVAVGRPVIAVPLGARRLVALSVEEAGSGTDRRVLRESWWALDRDGADVQHFAVESPPFSSGGLESMAFPADGDALLRVREDRPDTDNWFGLRRLAPDGSLRSREDFYPTMAIYGFVVGRDGRVVVLGYDTEEDPRASTGLPRIAVLAQDGRIEWEETLRTITPLAGGSPILAMDGTLYYIGWEDLQTWLVAVQTPVSGPQPGDTGWLRPVGRTPAGDWWAP